MSSPLILSALLLLLVAAFVHEAREHQRHLGCIPVRIHVNGTRGKSSVTRLIAAGLRAGGIRTIAKTTGTKPRFIYADGTEVPVVRAGKANIIEQVHIIRRAAQLEAEVLVLECMAIKPELQSLLEDRIVRSTHSAITNARADHLDEMGPTVADVARSLARTISHHGVFFTPDSTYLPTYRSVANERGTTVHAVDPQSVTAEELAGFSYIEHPDNVALALKICGQLGVSREVALKGMHVSTPDPGALRIERLERDGQPLWFVNGFAINDPDSYVLVWERLKEIIPPDSRIVGLLVCRPDRIQRSEQLGELVCHRLPLDTVLIAGDGTAPLLRYIEHQNLPRKTHYDLTGRTASEIHEHIHRLPTDRPAVIYGLGNIVGLGEEIAQLFSEKAEATHV